MKYFEVGDVVAVSRRGKIEAISKISRESKLYVFIPNYFGGSVDFKFKKENGCQPGTDVFNRLSIDFATAEDVDYIKKEKLRRKIKRAVDSGLSELSKEKLQEISDILYGGKDD